MKDRSDGTLGLGAIIVLVAAMAIIATVAVSSYRPRNDAAPQPAINVVSGNRTVVVKWYTGNDAPYNYFELFSNATSYMLQNGTYGNSSLKMISGFGAEPGGPFTLSVNTSGIIASDLHPTFIFVNVTSFQNDSSGSTLPFYGFWDTGYMENSPTPPINATLYMKSPYYYQKMTYGQQNVMYMGIAGKIQDNITPAPLKAFMLRFDADAQFIAPNSSADFTFHMNIFLLGLDKIVKCEITLYFDQIFGNGQTTVTILN